ncbi:MAG: hypothetical protein ACREFP_04100 [Acetobacteraceae bacterium]
MSEGIRIEVPEPTSEWGARFRLPSGRRAEVKPVTGRLLIQSQRLAGRDATPLEANCATIAVASRVDGRPLRYEEAQDLVAGDIQALVEAINAASFLGAPSMQSAPAS